MRFDQILLRNCILTLHQIRLPCNFCASPLFSRWKSGFAGFLPIERLCGQSSHRRDSHAHTLSARRRLRHLMRVLRQTRALCSDALRAENKVPSDSASRTRAMLAPLVADCLPFALPAPAPARCSLYSLQMCSWKYFLTFLSAQMLCCMLS